MTEPSSAKRDSTHTAGVLGMEFGTCQGLRSLSWRSFSAIICMWWWVRVCRGDFSCNVCQESFYPSNRLQDRFASEANLSTWVVSHALASFDKLSHLEEDCGCRGYDAAKLGKLLQVPRGSHNFSSFSRPGAYRHDSVNLTF